jgi:carboxyl-terminal processing protease
MVTTAPAPSRPASVPPPAASAVGDPAEAASACDARPLTLTSGGAATLRCEEARRIVAKVRARLASPAETPSAPELARQAAGWMDPHGLWSAAPDSPIRAALVANATRLVAELETEPKLGTPCAAAEEVGRVARDWAVEIRREMERARRGALGLPTERTRSLAVESVFQDDPVTRPGRALARDLGVRIGSFEARFGDTAAAVPSAVERLAPEQSVRAWSEAVLAAAVRAYVPAVDPHGQWAPLDEEWSLYAADPALDSEPRLWGRMVRTALGVKVEEDALPPLLVGDLVLSIGGVATAGLSVEQVDQLAHLESIGGESTREVIVLRPGEGRARALSVSLEQEGGTGEAAVAVERVPFGGKYALVVSIPDVPDELGEDLEQLVADLEPGAAAPAGILLDLRDNGGGSIDGAARALGLFLPGAPLFALKRRDGAIEIQKATAPSDAHVWRGPVAALVDGHTASAAEMIAGALLSYRRGAVVGARTFGKGCAQEYFDDPVGAGVLRLTTLLFALPDGAPIQRVGLAPTIVLDLPRVSERERSLERSLGPWQGPDVRAPEAIGGPEWPAHGGAVGFHADPVVRQALTRLGAAAPARRDPGARAGRVAQRSRAD